jgi:hypothetical protein
MRARARLFTTLLLAAVALAACSHGEQPSLVHPRASNLGILTGRITGASSTPPGAGVEIKIVRPDGTFVSTARTDAHGHYRVTLPAGEYRVERGAKFPGAATNLPAKVAVSRGEETRFDIWVGPGKS